MKVAIIGLPMTGKTSLFLLLTRGDADAGSVTSGRAQLRQTKVEDPRVERLAADYSPKKVTLAVLDFLDFPAITPPGGGERTSCADLLAPAREAGAFIIVDHWKITPELFLNSGNHFVKVLQVKVGLVAAIIVLSAFHDFVLGPRISDALARAREGGGEPSRGLKRGRLGLVWLARFNLLLVLAIVALAIIMTRGFPA